LLPLDFTPASCLSCRPERSFPYLFSSDHFASQNFNSLHNSHLISSHLISSSYLLLLIFSLSSYLLVSSCHAAPHHLNITNNVQSSI
jgi:hypothetical protein